VRLALLLALAPLACASEEPPVTAPEPLDVFVPEKLKEARVPGLSAAIVKNGKVVFTGAWGYADVENKKPVRTDTIFLVASISKTFIATAMMQLIEEGKVALDDDINKHLGFSVRNPRFPDKPITVRHLMSHSSSIQESYIRLFSLIQPGDSPIALEDYLKQFVVAGGKEYNDGGNFAVKYGPGGGNSYSQIGAALAGLIVEKVSGESFAARVKSKITAPLGMNDSSFRLADLPLDRIAFPYVYNGTKDVKQEHWGAGFYPAATMRTTALDLSKFLIAAGNKGAHAGGRLYSEATLAEALRVPFPEHSGDQAHLWQWRDFAGHHMFGHSGGAPGASSTMYFDPAANIGVITLSNADVHVRVSVSREDELAAFRAIEERLWKDAESR
jgi:CubicO group peptidase (beta-lactamase class C family)